MHVKYGKERGDQVMEFSSKMFATAHDVIDRALPAYGRCCILRLYNEHGRELDSGEVIKNARVYMVKKVAR